MHLLKKVDLDMIKEINLQERACHLLKIFSKMEWKVVQVLLLVVWRKRFQQLDNKYLLYQIKLVKYQVKDKNHLLRDHQQRAQTLIKRKLIQRCRQDRKVRIKIKCKMIKQVVQIWRKSQLKSRKSSLNKMKRIK